MPPFLLDLPRARRVLALAQEEARLLNHSFIGSEHILLGLIGGGEGIAARALDDLDISLHAARTKAEATIGQEPWGSRQAGSPSFTPRVGKVLELSQREALLLGYDYVGTERLLLAIAREGESIACQEVVLPNAGYPDDVYLDIVKKAADVGDRLDALRWAVTRTLRPGSDESR
jgi:ATP-dependent Clp protease ATP-binding subunit ClpC